MLFSPSTSRSEFQHARAVQLEAHSRDDGLWKFDAYIPDIKACDTTLVSGIRPVGTPMRCMSLRTAIDTKLNVAAEVAFLFYPRWAVKPQAQSESS